MPDTSLPSSRSAPAKTVLSEARQIGALGFPITLSLAGATLIGVVDTIMIAPLGTVALAAASLTTSALIIFYSGLYGFVSAIGVRMAEADGSKNPTALSDATKTGMLVATLCGCVGTVLMLAIRPLLGFLGQPADVVAVLDGYWTAMALLLIPFTVFYALKGLFDAIDIPWIGVALALMAVVINVPSNWVLIHGIGDWPGFGLLGAGLASLLSQSLALVVAVAIWRLSRHTAHARQVVKRSTLELRKQLREGSTIAVGYIGEGGAYAFGGIMLGWFGAEALAAFQIVNAIAGLLYMVPLGVAIAVSIRIGQAVGAQDATGLVRSGKAGLTVIITWMSVVMITLLLTSGWIADSLSDDPAVVPLAASMFLVFAAMQIFDGIQGTMMGACRGLSDNLVPVLVTSVCYWIIALPAGYVMAFVLGYGPNGVWFGYGLGLLLAAVAITGRFFKTARRIGGQV